MKLSCLPVSLYDDLTAGRRTLKDWFEFAAQLGLAGADISVVHLASREGPYLQTLRRQAEAAGVEIAMMVTYSDFTHPDAAERARQVDELRANIAAAAHLGTTFLRVTAGQAHPGLTRSDGIAWAIEGLTACLDEAAQANVTLVYENHSIGYGWTHFDFSHPADIFCEIVAFTEGSGLAVLYDTANNLARDDDPFSVLQKVKHRIAVPHVSDIRRTGHFEPVVVGTGVAPIEIVFEELRFDGFDGWVSIEEASKTGEDGFRQAVAYVKKTWQLAGEDL